MKSSHPKTDKLWSKIKNQDSSLSVVQLLNHAQKIEAERNKYKKDSDEYCKQMCEYMTYYSATSGQLSKAQEALRYLLEKWESSIQSAKNE